jgi:hypothetical protein
MEINMEHNNPKSSWLVPKSKEDWKNFARVLANQSREVAFTFIKEYLEDLDIEFPVDFVEVGFGQTWDFKHFSKQLHDQGRIVYTGYDITKQFVEYAQEEYPEYTFVEGSFLDLEKNSFDISYTRCVFEHLLPTQYEDCLRSLLAATRHFCVISWFNPPQNKERMHWYEYPDSKGVGAYVNTYDKSIIYEIIKSAGFDLEIFSRRDYALYLLKRVDQ